MKDIFKKGVGERVYVPPIIKSGGNGTTKNLRPIFRMPTDPKPR